MSGTMPASATISERDRKSMKRGLLALGFIVVFGSISWLLTRYWDTLPAPPQSHKIQLDGTPSNDPDHISAVLLRADFKQAASKEKLSMSRMTFYASDADPSEVARFYLSALSTPWHVAGDQESKGRRTIIYKELFQSDMKIILIERRLILDADHHVTYSSGSIIGTADVDAK
jgi:hypothetical protein